MNVTVIVNYSHPLNSYKGIRYKQQSTYTVFPSNQVHGFRMYFSETIMHQHRQIVSICRNFYLKKLNNLWYVKLYKALTVWMKNKIATNSNILYLQTHKWRNIYSSATIIPEDMGRPILQYFRTLPEYSNKKKAGSHAGTFITVCG